MKFTLALKNLPFEPQKEQIIFVESSYNEDVNLFIRNNYKRICEYCSVRGYKFCYLPKLTEAAVDADVLFYNVPYAKSEDALTPIGSDYLLSFMSHPENKELIPPSLLYYKSWDKVGVEETLFHGMSVTDQEEYPTLETIFFLRLDEIFEQTASHRFIKFQKVPEPCDIEPEKERKEGKISEVWNKFEKMLCEDDDVFQDYNNKADDSFDEESKQLAREVIERLEILMQRGVNMLPLIKYIKEKEPLSHLRITKDFRIFLPDYGNREIQMTPLPKAVFLLFLRHPEGIKFKCLPDYREELMEIYIKLKHTTDMVKMWESIDDVTNPFDNSINEKCARIREAFVCQFKEDLACNYFITGPKGEAKRITLPRELVEWEE